jgi:hypothetical protein
MWNQLIYFYCKELSLGKCIVELVVVVQNHQFRLNTRGIIVTFAYLASLPTEVVIVFSIIIQRRRPVATDEPGSVVAIGEGLVEGINKRSLVARK